MESKPDEQKCDTGNDVQRACSERAKGVQCLQQEKRTAAALGKKLNLRKVNPVKLFSKLTAAERLVFEQRAAEEIPYGYYVIGNCTRIETTTSNLSRASSVERGSSRKSKLVTTAGLNLTRIKPGDTPAILTIFLRSDRRLRLLSDMRSFSQEKKNRLSRCPGIVCLRTLGL